MQSMIARFGKNVARHFSSSSLAVPTPDTLTSADAARILSNPATDIIFEPKSEMPEPIKKEKKESIFDLNKSRMEDMYQLFLETKDIQVVNERFGVQLRGFKYGLPIPNIDPGFKNLKELKEELDPPMPTSLENLYTTLELTGDSSWNDYELAIQKKYNFHALLGGADDETPEAIELFKKVSTLSIPTKKLKDEKFMSRIRKLTTMNLNIPGCVEIIDPRRFFIDLRPVEEFRHTPQIPISSAEMRRFEEAKERRRNAPFELIYTKEKLFTLILFIIACGVIATFFKLGMDAEERMIIDYRRKKMHRDYNQPQKQIN